VFVCKVGKFGNYYGIGNDTGMVVVSEYSGICDLI
jgi:hypothetical protein